MAEMCVIVNSSVRCGRSHIHVGLYVVSCCQQRERYEIRCDVML